MSVTSHVLRVHEKVYVASDGRIGHKILGVPTLLLHTTGRRSGKTRTNGLVYARDGDDYLVVASNGGADRGAGGGGQQPGAPAWLHNLQADPSVEIQIGRRRQPATARIIESTDPDYPRVWQIVNQNNKERYTAYQQRTARPIPVIALTPS